MENIDIAVDIKTVVFPISATDCEPSVKCEIGVQRTKRVITENRSKWVFSQSDMEPDAQWKMACALRDTTEISGADIAVKQIRQKIYGYRTQDFAKRKYDHFLFIREKDVLDMLYDCNMECYYCHTPVMLIYEDVREPRQWSVERLDNAFGHNRGNTVIACLQCNLRRRTIRTERYVLTKSIAVVNKLA
jgi:hypothetical protein